MSFESAIEHFGKLSEKRIEDVAFLTTMDIAADVVKATPVGNEDWWRIPEAQKRWLKKIGYKGGRLRGNWLAWVGSPSKATNPKLIDPSGAGTLNNIRRRLFNQKSEKGFFISNNTPYAYAVDMGNKGTAGAKKKFQKPNGFFRLVTTAGHMRNVLNRNIKQVRSSL